MKTGATTIGQRPFWGMVETFHESSLQVAYAIRPYMLFFLAQFLIPLITEFRELLGLGEQFLGFGRENSSKPNAKQTCLVC